MLLEYESQMLEDTKEQSFLLVSSFGINLHNVIYGTIFSYLNKYSLAFIINFENIDLNIFKENEFFRDLQNLDKTERNTLYKRGGVFISTPRLIITDFLEGNVDISNVSCLIVHNAESVKEKSLEAFILYFYSKNCSEYSIKAFSTSCIPFSYGPNSLDKKMETLRLSNIVLYPRFHESIKSSFRKNIKFTENKLKMNNEYLEIQMVLIEMLKEVCRPLTKKYGHTYDFMLIVNQFKLFDIGDTSILYDIKDLKFLINLVQSGSPFLLYYVSSQMIKKQIDLGKESTWINCTSAMLFVEVLDKLINKIKKTISFPDKFININELFRSHTDHKKSIVTLNGTIDVNIHKRNDDTKEIEDVSLLDQFFSIESFLKNKKLKEKLFSFCNRKFIALVDFINKNKTEIIFVICDRYMVKKDILLQIKCIDLVTTNVNFYTRKEFTDLSFFSDGFKKIYQDEKTVGLGELIKDSKKLEDVCEVLESECFSSNVVKRFRSCFEDCTDTKLDFKILLYDLDIVILRFCEFLGNLKNISVDALAFKDSIEEERFLTSIRKEKFYFEQLIEKRAKVPIILDDDFDILEDESSHEEDNVYSIVIDIRELRAELVFMLYKSGNKIHISTLKVGDYLLSDEICIERKSIADLISSFNSGRLYTQALALTHAYVSPYLLLEFKGRPCLSNYCNVKTEGFKNSLISKLTIFLISFPTVKLIWSPNSLFSVKVIRILQRHTHHIESEQTIDIDPNLLDILLSIPGITQFNLKKVQKHFNNLKHLATSSQHEIISILGEVNGSKVFNFFNDEIHYKEK